MSRIRELWSRLTTQQRRLTVGGALALVAILIVGAVVIAGGGDDEQAATTTRPKPTTTTTTTALITTTTEPPTGPVAPLTGLRVTDPALINRPPLAVKIDNLDSPGESAVPQSGLIRADVVFEEVVEGNITRLVAVFHSRQPGRVGPIRSARTTDVQLLPQLGRPLLAWSGGNAGVTQAVRTSPSIIDAGWDSQPRSFARDHSRRAPHNLYAQGDELWDRAPAGTPPPPQLFEYRKTGEANPTTARGALGVDISWGPRSVAPASWRWDGKLRLYIRSQRGRMHTDADGTPITAKNVVVLVTRYGVSAADTRSPEAQTVGDGELFVFTNGRVLHGLWSRPDINRPAKLVDDQGQPIKLSPGQTWVELPAAGNTTAIMR
jgi:hypothetical protein